MGSWKLRFAVLYVRRFRVRVLGMRKRMERAMTYRLARLELRDPRDAEVTHPLFLCGAAWPRLDAVRL